MTQSNWALLDWALFYLNEYRMSVIPVCGKRATRKWKHLQTRLPTEQEVRAAGYRHATGIAVILGPVSDLVSCCDFDKSHLYPEWKANHSKIWKDFPTSKTGRGNHLFFRSDPKFQMMPNSEGEYRGTSGQYVVLPPSLHSSGSLYQWIVPLSKQIPFVDDPVVLGLRPQSADIQLSSSSLNVNNKSSVLSAVSPLFSKSLEFSVSTSADVSNSKSSISKRATRLVKMHTPTIIGERHRKLFDLAQALKSLRVEWTTEELSDVFKQWWRYAQDVVGTKEEMLSHGEFIDAFDRCKHPSGLDWKTISRDSAKEVLPSKAECYPPKSQMLVKLCAKMQRMSVGTTFYLSVRDAAEVIGSSPAAAHLGFRVMIRDGLLRVVEKGMNFNGKATTYQYLG